MTTDDTINKTPDECPQPKYIFWSTGPSVAKDIPSITAILETLAAIPLYWLLAVKLETYFFLILSAAVAPLVLLRSDKSAALGAKWFSRWALATKTDLEQSSDEPLRISFMSIIAVLISAIWSYLSAKFFLDGLEYSRAFAPAVPLGWASLTIAVATCVAGRQVTSQERVTTAVAVLTLAVLFIEIPAVIASGASAEGVFGFVLGTILGAIAAGMAVAGTILIATSALFAITVICGTYFFGQGQALHGNATILIAVTMLILPTVALFLSPVFFGYAVGVFITSAGVRIGATIRYLDQGFISLPRNFRRLTLCTSPLQVPELVPDLSTGSTGFTLPDIINALRKKATANEDFDRRLFAILFYIPVITVWFFPAWFYRITIKSTAWFWWPIAYFGEPLWRAHDPEEFRRATIGSLWAKANIVVALTTLCVFVFGNILLTLPATNPLITVFGYIFVVDWSAIFPYQILVLLLAGLSIGLVFLVDDAVGQHRHAMSKEAENLLIRSSSKLRWIERLARIRLILFLLFNLCVAGQTLLYINSLKCWFSVPENITSWGAWIYGDRMPESLCR